MRKINIEINDEIKYKNNIDKESKISEQILNSILDYCDKFDKNEKKAAITLKNAYIVEALLKIDSNYKNEGNKDKKPCIKFLEHITQNDIDEKTTTTISSYGSGAYWIDCYIRTLKGEKIEEEISGVLNRQKITKKYTIDEDVALKGVICAIDRENRTHLEADYIGRKNVYKRIKHYVGGDIEKLRNGFDSYDLIDEIAKPDERSFKKEFNGESKEIKERYHFSFATKFCRYVCLRLNENTKKADSFYIYDNVLKNNLKFYAEEYEVKKFEFSDFDDEDNSPKKQYIRYSKFLDEIRKKAKEKSKIDNEQVSRNALDHIIWYFNK